MLKLLFCRKSEYHTMHLCPKNQHRHKTPLGSLPTIAIKITIYNYIITNILYLIIVDVRQPTNR